MSLEEKLPPVAKSFFTFCTKCDADRYHTVVAHTSLTTAKMKCEVCGITKKYVLPKAQERKSSKPKVSDAVSGSGTKKIMTEGARQSAHKSEYEKLMTALQDLPAESYSMKNKFLKGVKIQHPKFGLGVVRESFGDKVEVVFSDEVRTLVHGR